MSIRLSNAQVNALAEKINQDLIASIINPVNEANRPIIESEEYKNFELTNEECITLRTIQEKYDFSSYDFNRYYRTIKSSYFKNKLQAIPTIASFNSIINEIHLATIDATDLDSLIKIVSSKLK
jgi:hypothetical protein